MITLKQCLIRFLKNKKLHGNKYDPQKDFKGCHEFSWWQRDLINYDVFINFNLWGDIIIKNSPKYIAINMPDDVAELSELTHYLMKNHVLWHSGDDFTTLLARHKALGLNPIKTLIYNKFEGRLTWKEFEDRQAMKPKYFYEYFDNLQKQLDMNTNRIFSINAK